MMEMPLFAKYGIEVRFLLSVKPPVTEPTEPTYEVEITGETEAQKINRGIRNQEKRVTWEKNVRKAKARAYCVKRYPEMTRTPK